jgi:hypothetical protein
MFKNERSEWNVEELTEAEIYAVICYLDPSLDHSEEQADIAGIVAAVILYIVGLGCMGFIWFYQWAH